MTYKAAADLLPKGGGCGVETHQIQDPRQEDTSPFPPAYITDPNIPGDLPDGHARYQCRQISMIQRDTTLVEDSVDIIHFPTDT